MKLTNKLLKKLIKEQIDSEAILDKIRQLAANKDLSSLLAKDQILALTRPAGLPDAAVLAAIDPLHFIDDDGGWDKYDLGHLPEPGPHQPTENELDDLYNTYGPAPEELSPAEQYAWYKKEYEQEPINEENQMKITTEMLRKMIQEEIADLKEIEGLSETSREQEELDRLEAACAKGDEDACRQEMEMRKYMYGSLYERERKKNG